jgi:hypothetical protein
LVIGETSWQLKNPRLNGHSQVGTAPKAAKAKKPTKKELAEAKS